MKRLLIALSLAALLPLAVATAQEHQHGHDSHAAATQHKHEHAQAGAEQTANVNLKEGEVIRRGAPLGDSPVVKFTDVVKAPRRYAGRQVIIEGAVQRVCQKQGCWMEIMPDKAERGIRIDFNDHAFFIPFNSAGLKARAEGTFSLKQLTKEEAEHYESEGAELRRDKDGEASALVFVATGVELRK